MFFKICGGVQSFILKKLKYKELETMSQFEQLTVFIGSAVNVTYSPLYLEALLIRWHILQIIQCCAWIVTLLIKNVIISQCSIFRPRRVAKLR